MKRFYKFLFTELEMFLLSSSTVFLWEIPEESMRIVPVFWYIMARHEYMQQLFIFNNIKVIFISNTPIICVGCCRTTNKKHVEWFSVFFYFNNFSTIRSTDFH